MKKYLKKNKDWLTVLVSIVVGFSSILATFVNAYLVNEQNKISLIQKTLQVKQNQPIFSISMPLERNPENGIFETENLEIYNKGQAMTQICETDVDVYFELVKSEGLKSDTIYFPVYDYFTYSVIGNVGDEEICHCGGRDNHKKFIELYHSTIEATNSSNNLYYFIYKVFLSRIEYTDIYEEKHIRYYIDKKEVSKEKYDKIVAHSYECDKYDNYNYSLNKLVTISFSDMKQVIDNVDRNKKK